METKLIIKKVMFFSHFAPFIESLASHFENSGSKSMAFFCKNRLTCAWKSQNFMYCNINPLERFQEGHQTEFRPIHLYICTLYIVHLYAERKMKYEKLLFLTLNMLSHALNILRIC